MPNWWQHITNVSWIAYKHIWVNNLNCSQLNEEAFGIDRRISTDYHHRWRRFTTIMTITIVLWLNKMLGLILTNRIFGSLTDTKRQSLWSQLLHRLEQEEWKSDQLRHRWKRTKKYCKSDVQMLVSTELDGKQVDNRSDTELFID